MNESQAGRSTERGQKMRGARRHQSHSNRVHGSRVEGFRNLGLFMTAH